MVTASGVLAQPDLQRLLGGQVVGPPPRLRGRIQIDLHHGSPVHGARHHPSVCRPAAAARQEHRPGTRATRNAVRTVTLDVAHGIRYVRGGIRGGGAGRRCGTSDGWCGQADAARWRAVDADPGAGRGARRRPPDRGRPGAARPAGARAFDHASSRPAAARSRRPRPAWRWSRADVSFTALLAADLPLLTGEAIDVLRLTVESAPDAGRGLPGRRGAPAVALRGLADDGAARRRGPASAEERGGLHGASVRALMEHLRVAEVSWRRPGPPPWFDCDTDDDLRTAEEWAR